MTKNDAVPRLFIEVTMPVGDDKIATIRKEISFFTYRCAHNPGGFVSAEIESALTEVELYVKS